jgi:hypothetical protein
MVCHTVSTGELLLTLRLYQAVLAGLFVPENVDVKVSQRVCNYLPADSVISQKARVFVSTALKTQISHNLK